MKLYKILCTGNPNKPTIASAVKNLYPESDFVHQSNGFDLRLWDEERKEKFINKVKSYNVFINASHISHMVQYDLLNVVLENWTSGTIINIGSIAEHQSDYEKYYVEKNTLKLRSLQIKGKIKSTHITIPGINDGKLGHENWMPLTEVSQLIKFVLESNVHIQLIQAI